MPLNNELTSGPYFRIHSTRREDAGVYHCVATNDVGSIFSDRLAFAVACEYSQQIPQQYVRIADYGYRRANSLQIWGRSTISRRKW